MIRIIACCFVLLAFASCEKQIQTHEFIDPFIGTDGHGHTYPGPSLPFGMIQPGPDTRLSGWDGCSGYHYSDSVIFGFSHTHLSGTGASDYGDVLLMPTVGPVDLRNFSSSFSHEKEHAEAGYYQVFLQDSRIQVELTTSQRVGLHKYTFPKSKEANIILDLEHRDEVLSSFIRVVDEYEIEGLRRSKSWAKDQYVYFVIRFSKPFKDYGLYLHNQQQSGTEINGTALKAHFSFSTQRREDILVKVGISAVSVDGARKNLENEIPGWRFSDTKNRARTAWQDVLNRYQITETSREKMRVFYTALYHQYLNPNMYMDVDSLFRGRDLLIHKADQHTNYTLFSLWDTFRATHPLFTIMERDRTTDFIKTFITQYEQGGMLPVWELSANETGTMIGYHSVSVIADALAKGIDGFNVEKAFVAMKNSAEQDVLGLRPYKELGYIPGSEESESVSKTLEYAYDDWCIAQTARLLGKEDDYAYYLKRSKNYINVFDPATKFFRGKISTLWFAPFDPYEVNFNFTEANAWQYRFFVPHDIKNLMSLQGGQSAFIQNLDSLFETHSTTSGRIQADITGLIGQYAHGNEPSHHVAYLYALAGQAWKTQKYINQILSQFYSDQPDGLCGNEDCGQMSAWYLFSSMGFYPVTPGSETYVLGAPLFKQIKLQLENGKSFQVDAPGKTDENIYVQSVKLNGLAINRPFITHAEIMDGGTLEFEMGPKPSDFLNTPSEEYPVFVPPIIDFIPSPFVSLGEQTFKDRIDIELACADTAATIFYEVVGLVVPGNENFREFISPIRLTDSRKIRFYARKDTVNSPVCEAFFYKLSNNRSVVQISEYANQYSAGGQNALIDQIRGARDFRTGAWQGFEGSDLLTTIDLGITQTISRIGLNCFQDQSGWIFMPLKVVYEISLNGVDFEEVAVVENDIEPNLQGAFIKEFKADVWRTARFVRVRAINIKTCPEWHPGAGGKAWLFADELIIE